MQGKGYTISLTRACAISPAQVHCLYIINETFFLVPISIDHNPCENVIISVHGLRILEFIYLKTNSTRLF